MRYLKTRKDSDALAYQRHVAKPLKSRARVMHVSDPIVIPLKLKKGAPDVEVAAEIQACNEIYDTLMRFLTQSDIPACGAQVSMAAPSCVHCGHPLKSSGLNLTYVAWFLVGSCLLLLGKSPQHPV